MRPFRPLLFAAALLSLPVLHGSACTTAIVRAEASASGRPLIWKQRDAEDRSNHLAHFQGSRYAFTGIVDSGHPDHVWGGANTEGFLIANNLSYNLRPDSLSGKPMTAGKIMKEALGFCRTVAEFEAMLLQRPEPRRVSANFAVADAFGGAAYFEVWDYGYTRYDVPEGGMLWRTNYSLSGDPDRGKGYGRYDLMNHLTALHGPAGYTPEWFLEAGRQVPIARPTTVSSFVLEGGADGPVIWAATGYTPCCYAVPVWVAAGEAIPDFLTEGAAQNRLARSLQERGDAQIAARILPAVRKAEKKEFRTGRRLDRRFRQEGLNGEALARYNRAAEVRFRSFQKRMQP